jgi:hypothetical protein
MTDSDVSAERQKKMSHMQNTVSHVRRVSMSLAMMAESSIPFYWNYGRPS